MEVCVCVSMCEGWKCGSMLLLQTFGHFTEVDVSYLDKNNGLLECQDTF